MGKKIKIGIIICNRYRNCAGGKCFRALAEKSGAFDIYKEELDLVGFTSCGGCPGGNIEYAPEEMKKNGAEVIHLATGLVVGYPPCPYIEHFQKFIPEKYDLVKNPMENYLKQSNIKNKKRIEILLVYLLMNRKERHTIAKAEINNPFCPALLL